MVSEFVFVQVTNELDGSTSTKEEQITSVSVIVRESIYGDAETY